MINRRTFVMGLGAGATLAGSASAAKPLPSAHSDKIQFGFIGLGRQGTSRLNEFMKHPDVVAAAVSDDARAAYTRRSFREYGMVTDPSGRYTALYRPYHLIGLELGISVAAAALRKEATGVADGFRSDVAAVAKKALAPGDMLDGEGGYTVGGRIMRAHDSLRRRALPIGLRGLEV